MLGFDDYLSTKGCVVLKQFKQAEDRSICLVRYPDDSRAVWRCYDRPVPAYEKLVGIKCGELPEVYRYTETEQGGCLVEEEFVDGVSLGELISGHRLDEPQTAAIARRVCKALAVLHGLDMVHRDVKPENILVSSKGRVVLIDLDAVSPKSSAKERDTRLLGTVGYAAPEQYGFGHSDGRADIFGVGVLMNVLLTGKHPVRQLADGALRKVIERCIAVNVDQRYATVEQLMEQLPNSEDRFCPDCGFASPGGGCIFCGKPGTGGHVRQKRMGPWVAAIVLLLVLAVGAGAFLPEKDHADEPVVDIPPVTDAETETSDSAPEPLEPQVSSTPSLPDDTAAPDEERQTEEDPPREEPDVQESVNVVVPEPVSTEPPQPQSTPEPSPTPQPTPTKPEESGPVYSGEWPTVVAAFSYDLNGDAVAEEYYFGLLLDKASPPVFCTRDVIRYEPGKEGYVIRKAVPAVWKQTQDGGFVLEDAFADLLTEPEISVYKYRETDTTIFIQAAGDLYGWRGAAEIQYRSGQEDMWLVEAAAMLGETKLTASILAVVTVEVEQAAGQEIMLTDGVPVGQAQSIAWHSNDELVVGEYTVYDCTAQRLDNGYLRFSVDYISPEGMKITVFDPPDGVMFQYKVGAETTGEREQLVFDMPSEQVYAAGKISIVFSYKNGSRFLVFVDDTSGL